VPRRAGEEVEELILDSIELKLRTRQRQKQSRRVNLPLIPSHAPHTLDIDNARIFEIVPFP